MARCGFGECVFNVCMYVRCTVCCRPSCHMLWEEEEEEEEEEEKEEEEEEVKEE